MEKGTRFYGNKLNIVAKKFVKGWEMIKEAIWDDKKILHVLGAPITWYSIVKGVSEVVDIFFMYVFGVPIKECQVFAEMYSQKCQVFEEMSISELFEEILIIKMFGKKIMHEKASCLVHKYH